jgi:chromosome segregation ATPase
MSDEHTRNPPDSRSFEERVFARFDALDAGMARMESRLDDLTTRVETLEAESERRAADTKPIWERALAEIVALNQKVDGLERKVDALEGKVDELRGEVVELRKEVAALNRRVETIEHKLDVFASDMLSLRGKQRQLEERMDKLDSEHAR